MNKPSAHALNNFTVKWSEAIWTLYQARVFQEITNLLGVDEATTSTLGWFQMQMLAIKQLFNKMDTQEKSVLDDEQEKMVQQGYPEQMRQR
jgi:hypothetical protein